MQFGDDPFQALQSALTAFVGEPIKGLPPFQGGIAGLMDTNLDNASSECRPLISMSFSSRRWLLDFFDWVIAWDHRQQLAHG